MREMYGHLKLLAALRERQVGPEPEAHNFGKRVECVGENRGASPVECSSSGMVYLSMYTCL